MKIVTKTTWNLPTFEELKEKGYSVKTEEELLDLVCDLNDQELSYLCGGCEDYEIEIIEEN